MKRILQSAATVAMLLFFSGPLTAQTVKEFFNNSELPLTYLGIDYSKAKLINEPDANTFDIKNRLYGAMNDLVINEPKNYDISGAFRKSNFSTDLTAVRAKNEKINADAITSGDEGDFNRLKEADIAAEVKSLAINKTGIGLVFIMEGMKKQGKKSYGSVWVVLVDMKSKKVLMAERMEQEPSGFGFRNFWASVIKKSIIEIDKKAYKSWKTKYGA